MHAAFCLRQCQLEEAGNRRRDIAHVDLPEISARADSRAADKKTGIHGGCIRQKSVGAARLTRRAHGSVEFSADTESLLHPDDECRLGKPLEGSSAVDNPENSAVRV